MKKLFVLRDEVAVNAPLERCFLLSTSVALVARLLKMQPVAGRTTGLVADGDTVRWEGQQLGFPQVHTSLIESYKRYSFFRDRMIAGRFSTFEHDHAFRDLGDEVVLLSDEVRFTMPFGWMGHLVGSWVLVPHIRSLMRRRFSMLKQIAEGNDWQAYLPHSPNLSSHLSADTSTPSAPLDEGQADQSARSA